MIGPQPHGLNQWPRRRILGTDDLHGGAVNRYGCKGLADLVKFAGCTDDNIREEGRVIRAASGGVAKGPTASGESHGWSGSEEVALARVILAGRRPGGHGAGVSGCLGPKAVRYTRMQYNEVVRSTNDEQLLMNIVRLRYADSPVFIDLPSITSQFEVAGEGNYLGGYGNQTPARASLGFGELSLRDTPTLSYHPREGREIAKALLTPLSADLFIVVNAGANIEQLLLLTLNDMNDVPNAPRATTLVPKIPDDNAEFLRGIRLLASLRDRDATELELGTHEENEGSSDPIPKSSVGGRDVLNAAKDGYVYRDRGDGQMTLLKREKELYLRIREPFVDSPEMEEVARIFNLIPGRNLYRIKSELSEEAKRSDPSPLGKDTIYMNLRSVLQIMTFLSKGVCVPDEHVRMGIAPMTPGPDGRPFDWTSVTAGNFFVGSQKHRPHEAEVAVQYRGYWFYIAPDDVNSRAVLAILEILFALQESDGKTPGPLLTLPLGGG